MEERNIILHKLIALTTNHSLLHSKDKTQEVMTVKTLNKAIFNIQNCTFIVFISIKQ